MARQKKKKPPVAKPVDTAPTQPKLAANKFPVVVKNNVGRPSDYNFYVASRICGKITEGKSLSSICREDDMPSSSTVFLWLNQHREFSEAYARAIENRTELTVEQMLDIADDEDEDPQSRRVRLDTRKWIASKLKPLKYGDSVIQKHTGPRGDEPVQITSVTIAAENLDPDSRETLRQALLLSRQPAQIAETEEEDGEDE